MSAYRQLAEVEEDLPMPENLFDAEKAATLAQEAKDKKKRLFEEKVDSVDIKEVWEKDLLPQIEEAAKKGSTETDCDIKKYFFEQKGNHYYGHTLSVEETKVLERLVALMKSKGFSASFERDAKGRAHGRNAYALSVDWSNPKRTMAAAKVRSWRSYWPVAAMLLLIAAIVLATLFLF